MQGLPNIVIILKFGLRLRDFLLSFCVLLTEELFDIMVGVFIFLQIMNILIYYSKAYKKESVNTGWRIKAILFNGPGTKIVHD